MDLRTVLTISALLLMTADQTTGQSNDTSSPTQTSNTTSNCHCPIDAQTVAAPTLSSTSSAPALGFLTIGWMGECKGVVQLTLYLSASALPVCNDSEINVRDVLKNVCQNNKSCKGTPTWKTGSDIQRGYHIKQSGAEERTDCVALRVHCAVEAVLVTDVQGQLRAYKVVTALLFCVLLVLLLIRFTKPTVKALQKRLSDRRQNRWIGPTQSHSVSYHRGKTAVQNNDGEKRLSYPALERLAVYDSREPSSNRNSDYNF